MRNFTGTLALALAVVLNSIELGLQMENDPEREEPVRRIQSSDISRVTIIHCLPTIAPLIFVRKLIGTEIKKFTEPATILKKGDVVYGWDNKGIITELYDRNGHQIVLHGKIIRKVKNMVAFRELFGIGESMSTLAAAARYPAYPAGTSRPRN